MAATEDLSISQDSFAKVTRLENKFRDIKTKNKIINMILDVNI